MKRLTEQDQKRQDELDKLVKAKATTEKGHAEQREADQKVISRLQGEVTRVQGVEAEQHKTERALKAQIASVTRALMGMFICFLHPEAPFLHPASFLI